jgi:ribonuclease T2
MTYPDYKMLSALLPLLLVSSATAGESDIRSCSSESLGDNVDPCSVPSPAGLLVFRQRFEPDVGGDMGSWGIDGLEVLE